jgi:hypothetical protein
MKRMLCVALLSLGLPSVGAGDAPAIYRCDDGGAVIYSDRPCSPGANQYEIDESRVTVYEAPPAAQRAPKATAKAVPLARKNRKVDSDHEQRAARCNKLKDSLRDVRTKMRTGYGVKEGERLKARHRQLTQQRRSDKCS